MPGCSGGPVVTTLVCFFILHARLRVHWASGIPHALSWAESSRKTRTRCAAGSRLRISLPELGIPSVLHSASRDCLCDLDGRALAKPAPKGEKTSRRNASGEAFEYQGQGLPGRNLRASDTACTGQIHRTAS